MHQYGININTLDKFITAHSPEKRNWGSYTAIISVPEFKMERYELSKNAKTEINISKENEATFFVEAGSATINDISLASQEVISVPPDSKIKLESKEGADLYVFCGPAGSESKYFEKTKPFDYREKYWGSIQSIISRKYAGKRIFVRKGEYSSLEYHCRKIESYFIHSGKLLARLRAGRGEDKFFEMPAGSTLLTPFGLMHQRGGLEDTVIIEISTKDEDSDSYLVEDGQKQPFPTLAERVYGFTEPKSKRVVFDLDGCLCTQEEGGYENAKPFPEAISVVNRLYKDGYHIIIHTARFMGRAKGEVKRAYEEGYEFTKKQLKDWGILYHKLVMGKPPADIVVDDRSVFHKHQWDLIEKEIRQKCEKS